MTTANKITILRILLIPFFVVELIYYLQTGNELHRLLALLSFAVTAILDGVPGAWHTADLQFCFDNTKRCEQGTGNTSEAQALAKKMAASWAAFAAAGNPSIPGLNWAPTDPDTNRTMIWDNDGRMADDPEAEARKIILT